MSRGAAARVGAGSVGLSAFVTCLIAMQFYFAQPDGHVFRQSLWTLFDFAGMTAEAAFHLDSLSLLMTLVVTLVGFLIHVYSTEYMKDDAGFARFFAYMNLFVAAMLTLVLADNLFLLFLGWEGVGVCSFLLIGFWYDEEKNCRAATKAFLVTRVGDVFLAVGVFFIFAELNTLQIATIAERAPAQWTIGSGAAVAAALLLLGGAIGKSGQLPLQVWLPDAMAGPTPVSALIHAATMVTAGVYLIARMHPIFQLAPSVMYLVAIIGAITLLLAGCCALVQRDIKRALAYSTISQIGYMFLALGVGAWSAAMFHFMTHAIFKALLFMAAGAVIVALHHEQDMFKMGGLKSRMPAVFLTFLIGAGSLCAIPFITSGFYSKDMILYEVWASEQGGRWLWGAGYLGALLTAIYTFRMVFLIFYGTAKTPMEVFVGMRMTGPLLVLAAGATVAGFLEIPKTLIHLPIFSSFLEHTLPHPQLHHASLGTEWLLQGASALAVFVGIAIAYARWGRGAEPASVAKTSDGFLHRLLSSGWGFDWLYDRVIVRPYGATATANRNDVIDFTYSGAVQVTEEVAYALRLTQSGRLRWYIAGIGLGAVVAIAMVVYA